MEFKDILRKIKNWSIRLSILAVLLYLGISFLLSSMTYSEGFIIGVPNNFSKKGLIFKSFEGDLKVGQNEREERLGINDGRWSFTVDKDDAREVQADIEKAILENKRAKFYYKEKFRNAAWKGDTKFFVYKVELID
jgi:hypothetical protein